MSYTTRLPEDEGNNALLIYRKASGYQAVSHTLEAASRLEYIILVLPCEVVEEELKIIQERWSYNMSYDESSMKHASNMILAKHIVYTKDKKPEESSAEVLRVIEHKNN